jgi:hypothetical protein
VFGFCLLGDEEGVVLADDNFWVLGHLALGVCSYALLLLLELLEDLYS